MGIERSRSKRNAELAKAGDWNGLLLANTDFLWSRAHAIAPNFNGNIEAEELFQLFSVKFLEKVHLWNPSKSTIAAYFWRACWRWAKEYAHGIAGPSFAGLSPPAPTPLSESEQLEEREHVEKLKALLRDAISELTDLERVVIEARYYRGLSNKEVAKRLGSSQAAVSSTCGRGLRRLRALFLLRGSGRATMTL